MTHMKVLVFMDFLARTRMPNPELSGDEQDTQEETSKAFSTHDHICSHDVTIGFLMRVWDLLLQHEFEYGYKTVNFYANQSSTSKPSKRVDQSKRWLLNVISAKGHSLTKQTLPGIRKLFKVVKPQPRPQGPLFSLFSKWRTLERRPWCRLVTCLQESWRFVPRLPFSSLRMQRHRKPIW